MIKKCHLILQEQNLVLTILETLPLVWMVVNHKKRVWIDSLKQLNLKILDNNQTWNLNRTTILLTKFRYKRTNKDQICLLNSLILTNCVFKRWTKGYKLNLFKICRKIIYSSLCINTNWVLRFIRYLRSLLVLQKRRILILW